MYQLNAGILALVLKYPVLKKSISAEPPDKLVPIPPKYPDPNMVIVELAALLK